MVEVSVKLKGGLSYRSLVKFVWRDLQFRVDSERLIFGETFRGNFYLLSEFLPEIC